MTASFTIPRGITRHEYGRTSGWLVRVYRTTGGEQKCARRLFSDGVYGGELQALDAAIEWQLEQLESRPARERKRTAGYGYVYRGLRSYRTVAGELRTYEAFIACFWDAQDRVNSTSYGVEAHGEAEAERRAHDWLERERRQYSWNEPPSIALAAAV